jgi:ATP synthase I subunit
LDERESFVHGTLAGAVLVGAAGTVLLLLFGPTGWAVSFGLGAGVSLGNFTLITHAVTRLTDADTRKASRLLWKGALFRFAIVGTVLFVAVVALQVNVLALVAGLLLTQLVMVGIWLVRSMRATT